MAINFNEDALPALIAMAEFEPSPGWDNPDRFQLWQFLQDELGQTLEKATRVARLLASDGLIEPHNGVPWTGADGQLASAQITPNGLKLLDLWPTEGNELKYIVAQIADALEDLADDASTDEESTKLRTAAGYVKGLAGAVVANILAGGIAG